MERVDTENIVALFQPVEARALVITFAHMDFESSGARFWGQEALVKGGFAGLGLICKSNCWFPDSDMRAIESFVASKTRFYETIVLYGFSMGGYAAVKFSALLGANYALALSPQFSIDPSDVAAHDRRLLRHFVPGLNKDMAIKEKDVGGTVLIFFDPFVTEDKWNSEMIARSCQSATALHMMQVPGIGHETIDIFAGAEPLHDLIKFVMENDILRVRKLTADNRRVAQRRIFNVITKTQSRWPGCGARIGEKYRAGLSSYWQQRLPGVVQKTLGA